MRRHLAPVLLLLMLALPGQADDVEISGNNYFQFAKIYINTTQQANNFSQYNTTDTPANTLQFYINQSLIRFSATANTELKNIAYNNLTRTWNYTGIATSGSLNTTVKINASTNYSFKVDGTTSQTKVSDAGGWTWFVYSGWSQHDFEIAETASTPTSTPTPTPTPTATPTPAPDTGGGGGGGGGGSATPTPTPTPTPKPKSIVDIGEYIPIPENISQAIDDLVAEVTYAFEGTDALFRLRLFDSSPVRVNNPGTRWILGNDGSVVGIVIYPTDLYVLLSFVFLIALATNKGRSKD